MGIAYTVSDLSCLVEDEPEQTCDICGICVAADENVSKSAYLWTRGDERRIEEVPVCSYCGTAIGVTLLQRWAIQEEEG